MNYVTMFLWFPKRAAAEPSGSDTAAEPSGSDTRAYPRV